MWHFIYIILKMETFGQRGGRGSYGGFHVGAGEYHGGRGRGMGGGHHYGGGSYGGSRGGGAGLHHGH